MSCLAFPGNVTRSRPDRMLGSFLSSPRPRAGWLAAQGSRVDLAPVSLGSALLTLQSTLSQVSPVMAFHCYYVRSSRAEIVVLVPHKQNTCYTQAWPNTYSTPHLIAILSQGIGGIQSCHRRCTRKPAHLDRQGDEPPAGTTPAVR